MRHGSKHRKFGRETKQRKELMRDLSRALITNGKITTTQAKAKSLRPYIEKLITKSRVAGLAATRILSSRLGAGYAKKMIMEIGPKFTGRQGGYTRIINLPPRLSDGAKMAIIELLE